MTQTLNITVTDPATGSTGNTTVTMSDVAITPPPSQVLVPFDKTYALVFDDEFNGTTLDGSKWTSGWFPPTPGAVTKGINSAEDGCLDPAQLTFKDGALNITAIAKTQVVGGKTWPHTTGGITSNGKFSVTPPAYCEARLLLPAAGTLVGNWPCWWTDGQNWPTDGEIDIAEGLGGIIMSHFHNSAGQQAVQAQNQHLAGAWHIFASWWKPDGISFYIDNVLIGTVTSGITTAPHYLILHYGTSPQNQWGGPVLVPATMLCDWIHVYRSGGTAIPPQPGYTGPGGGATPT